ncbi:MAG: carboxymuconolactone decarboxylase family protein [Desulfobacterales bacterium]|nr:carboxymuconolactone decarboxylase family protein [Desulfobacterales bacterium]
MLPEEQNQAFQTFTTGVKQNEILDPKTTRLIYLAVAMALGCYP